MPYLSTISKIAPKIILTIFIAMLLWWLSINFRGIVDTTENFYYGFALGIFAVIGGLGGFTRAKKWGIFSSYVGKATTFLSLGLIIWGIGTIIFSYYNIVLGVEVPYPSIADAVYIVSWPLWIVGMVNLSRATGVRYQLRSAGGKIAALTLIAIAFIISYYLLFVVALGGVVEIDKTNILLTFFNFAYPVGDVIILTTVLFIYGLSFKYLGGRFKWPIIFILSGFCLNYVADLSFAYRVATETFYVAGWTDLIFTITMFTLGYGINKLDPSIKSRADVDSFEIKNKTL